MKTRLNKYRELDINETMALIATRANVLVKSPHTILEHLDALNALASHYEDNFADKVSEQIERQQKEYNEHMANSNSKTN